MSDHVPLAHAVPRRAVAKAAAWTIPAVSFATAAPASAASSGPATCTTSNPFTVNGFTASWTNTTSDAILVTYVTTVPLGSVWNTTVGNTPAGMGLQAIAYSPPNGASHTFTGGGTLNSDPATVTSTSLTWTATALVQPGATLRLSTQAGSCKASAPQATVHLVAPTDDCPFTYPVDCPT